MYGYYETAAESSNLTPPPPLARFPVPPTVIQTNVLPGKTQALKDTEYKGWKTQVLDATFPVSSGPDGLMEALDNICMESSEALRGGNCQVSLRGFLWVFGNKKNIVVVVILVSPPCGC